MENTEERPVVLVAERDEYIVQILKNSLSRNEIEAVVVTSSKEVLSKNRHQNIRCFVISEELDQLSGVKVSVLLKNKADTKNIPIIMLTDNKARLHRIIGIENGIDDVIEKPFSINEAMTKIKRFTSKFSSDEPRRLLEYKNLKIDLEHSRVYLDDNQVSMGPIEFKILQCLLENKRKVVTRQYIKAQIWGDSYKLDTRTIDVHINRLRSNFKIHASQENLPIIHTVRSAGYAIGYQDSL